MKRTFAVLAVLGAVLFLALLPHNVRLAGNVDYQERKNASLLARMADISTGRVVVDRNQLAITTNEASAFASELETTRAEVWKERAILAALLTLTLAAALVAWRSRSRNSVEPAHARA